jgi:hypothetical protein
MRAKHGWHIRFLALDAPTRMTPPHHTQTTAVPPSACLAPVLTPGELIRSLT